MKEISKRTAIQLIVDDDINTVQEQMETEHDYCQYLTDMLMYGCEGWFNQTVTELQRELDNRFNDQYIINNEL